MALDRDSATAPATDSGRDLVADTSPARGSGPDLAGDRVSATGPASASGLGSNSAIDLHYNSGGIRTSAVSQDSGAAASLETGQDQVPDLGEDLTEAEREADAPAVAGWVGFVFVCGGLAVVPWTVYLALTLPLSSQSGHYRMAWVGFDLLLAFTLLHVGWIAAGGPTRNDRVELPATAAATLLLVDAWFDATTAANGGALLEALLFAVFGELPMAGVCFWIAHHDEEIRQRRLRLLPRLERLGRR